MEYSTLQGVIPLLQNRRDRLSFLELWSEIVP
jgi:hypothetical protein